MIFDLADEEKMRSIETNVLNHDRITPITTPHFEVLGAWQALAKLGNYSMVLEEIDKSVLGRDDRERRGHASGRNMTRKVEGVEQYAMYGDRFGRRASAMPGVRDRCIFLHGYFFGLAPTEPGYKSFVISPVKELTEDYDVALPVGSGSVEIIKKGSRLTVRTDRDGGLLEYGGKQYLLEFGSEITVDAAGNTADSSEDE